MHQVLVGDNRMICNRGTVPPQDFRRRIGVRGDLGGSVNLRGDDLNAEALESLGMASHVFQVPANVLAVVVHGFLKCRSRHD
jgi:hypothetical protein